MSVSIRLKRLGAKKRPYYRIVVMDSHEATKGRPLEEIGFYHPVEAEDKQVKLNAERAAYWLSTGAIPSDTVRKIMAKNGVDMFKKVAVAAEDAVNA